MLLNPIQAAFEGYWSAQVYQIVKRQDAGIVFARSFTYLALVMSFCGVGVLVASRLALHLLTSPAYYRAAPLIPIILAAYFVRALGDFFRYLFLANGVPVYDAACNWASALFSLGAYFWLIPRQGIQGAALATLMTFLFGGVIASFWSYRIWTYQLEGIRLTKLLGVTTLIVLLHFLLPAASAVVEVGLGVGLLTAFVGLLALVQFASPGEKQILNNARLRLVGIVQGTR
jgi:O-antigen/teichoic acid export membrane protein